ncbi:MAG: DUF5615 family PIN-like protein [Kofleriaceae bacterium]
MRFLLDENITPAAAGALTDAGIDGWHVRDRGLEGATDPELLDRAYKEDRILITLNISFSIFIASSTITACPGGTSFRR